MKQKSPKRLSKCLCSSFLMLLIAGCATRVELYPKQSRQAPSPGSSTNAQQQEGAATVVEVLPVPAPTTQAVPTNINPGLADSSPAIDDKLMLLQGWISQQQRLYQVAAPLLILNTGLCPIQARKILGFTAKNAYSYPSEFISVAQSGMGLGERLQVASVLAGSGAAKVGLQPGDILTAVAEQPLPEGEDAERMAGSAISDAIQGAAALDVTVQRGTDSMIIEVPLTPACAMVIDLGNTSDVNSYADGKRVMVTRGMLDFVRSDAELAAVLAREIAFNLVTLSPRPEVATVIDRLHTLSTTPATTPPSVLAPTTAIVDAAVDRMALYMLARAGYSLDTARAFWVRLAQSYPAQLPNSYSALHTPLPERLAVIDKTIPIIKTKQKTGQPLIP